MQQPRVIQCIDRARGRPSDETPRVVQSHRDESGAASAQLLIEFWNVMKWKPTMPQVKFTVFFLDFLTDGPEFLIHAKRTNSLPVESLIKNKCQSPAVQARTNDFFPAVMPVVAKAALIKFRRFGQVRNHGHSHE